MIHKIIAYSTSYAFLVKTNITSLNLFLIKFNCNPILPVDSKRPPSCLHHLGFFILPRQQNTTILNVMNGVSTKCMSKRVNWLKLKQRLSTFNFIKFFAFVSEKSQKPISVCSHIPQFYLKSWGKPCSVFK